MFDAYFTNDNPGGKVGIEVGGFKLNEGATRRTGGIDSFLKKAG
jgi:hypothetical protein